MTGKLLFRNTIQGKHDGKSCFVPFIYRLASRITNTPLKDMVWDATYYTYSIESAYRLLNSSVICNAFDCTIECESCGCEVVWPGLYEKPYLAGLTDFTATTRENFLTSGRIPIILEATKRLTISLGRECGIVGVVTGPCTLTCTLRRIAAGEGFENKNKNGTEIISMLGALIISYVRALCELKIDAVLFREDVLGTEYMEELLLHKDAYRRVYGTLFNIVKAYNAFSLLTLKSLPVETIKKVASLLKVNGIILYGQNLNESDLTLLRDICHRCKISVGLPLPIENASQETLWNQLDLYESFIKKNLGSFFYTSNEEIPYDISMEVLHDLLERLQ